MDNSLSISIINPSVKRAFIITYAPKTSRVFCSYHQMFIYIYSDNLKLQIKDNLYIVQSGELCYVPPGRTFRIITGSHACSVAIICFNFKENYSYEYELSSSEDYDKSKKTEPEYNFSNIGYFKEILRVKNRENIKNLITTICTSDPLDKIHLNLSAKGYFCLLLDELFKVQKKGVIEVKSYVYSQSVTRAIDYITKNISMSDMSLRDIANAAGTYSPNHFGHIFKEITSKTPIEYLTESRIQKSALLLKKNWDMGIEEIAYTCGFNNPKYFSTKFKKQIGVCPKEYRSLNLIK
ncbi:MAG: helix-turn-helix transcriptional regulator [Verrucomicrobiota bacterium]|nr:helix-turn-helix transcriptional regulator [Verrucomicrobiota bacterium]